MVCVVVEVVVFVLVEEGWRMSEGDGFSLGVKLGVNLGLAFGAFVFLFSFSFLFCFNNLPQF